MPKIVKRLTDREIENAKPKEKNYKLYDGDGLQLLVRRSGTKVWQYPYSFNGKRNIYTVGKYLKKNIAGHVSIFDARQIRYEISSLLEKGINPNEHKDNSNNALDNDYSTFEVVAREWHSKGTWVSKHAQNIIRSLERDAFIYIGHKQINEIKPQDIVSLLSHIEDRGSVDVAKRTCQRCEAIFDYAIIKGLCELNPAIGRSKFIRKRKTVHRPHLNETQMPEFLNKLDSYHGRSYIRDAMHLLVLTFLRPGELRGGQWSEIDFGRAVWHKGIVDHDLESSVSNINVMYQKSENEYHARSFEDAFLNVNQDTIKDNVDDLMGLQKKSELDGTKDPYDLIDEILVKKSHFASSVLYLALAREELNWQTPLYIKDGLAWVQSDDSV